MRGDAWPGEFGKLPTRDASLSKEHELSLAGNDSTWSPFNPKKKGESWCGDEDLGSNALLHNLKLSGGQRLAGCRSDTNQSSSYEGVNQQGDYFSAITEAETNL
jgi:hypothetical protein